MLLQNFTFPNQISYAGFVGNYGRNFDLINYFMAMSKNREGKWKKWQVPNSAVKQKIKKCHFDDENRMNMTQNTDQG